MTCSRRFFFGERRWKLRRRVDLGDYFGGAIFETERHDVLARMAGEWHGSFDLVTHALVTPIFWLAAAGVFVAWFLYLKRPDILEQVSSKISALQTLLVNKYYFDDLYIKGFAAGGRRIGQFLWNKGDELVIDGVLVNGTAKVIGRLAGVLRQLQTGYLYDYAFAMFFGLTAFLGWLLWF